MAETARVRVLLRRAREILDTPGCPLGPAAAFAWRRPFVSGGRWMQGVLAHLRGRELPAAVPGLNTLGAIKYALAGGAALLVGMPAVLLRAWPLLALSVIAFYAVEAQMVFLFPVALDGARRPFREARRSTARAGGTLAVMTVVLPVAGVMVLGGFARQGFVRSWCLGCLAVCIWYEDVRGATPPLSAANSAEASRGRQAPEDSPSTPSAAWLLGRAKRRHNDPDGTAGAADFPV